SWSGLGLGSSSLDYNTMSKTVNGYPGETITINCSYPEGNEVKFKYLFKQSREYFNPVISTTDINSQRERFSISEDTRSRVISVTISDLKEDDEDVYSCGVWTGMGVADYLSLFTDIHLQISGEKSLAESKPQHQPIRFSLPVPKPQHQQIRFSQILMVFFLCSYVHTCQVLDFKIRDIFLCPLKAVPPAQRRFSIPYILKQVYKKSKITTCEPLTHYN
uniref:Immunoglobulin domain-containing protein n=1 Tax=Astyanax mexicanus TaxID=7994 RepID=A0A3B1JZ55_ASTMX